MEHTELFEELSSPAAGQRTPYASHHYVADEDSELFAEDNDTNGIAN
jgi:hypothetical protein